MMTLFIIAGWFYFVITSFVWLVICWKLTRSHWVKENLTESKESPTPVKESL